MPIDLYEVATIAAGVAAGMIVYTAGSRLVRWLVEMIFG